MPNNFIIKVNQLTHYYGKVKAVDNVSLAIPKGASIGLVGPDGVGKSSLLSLIAGVKVIQQGQIKVFDEDISLKHVRLKLSHRIAFMPQGLGKNLYFSLSVFENIDCFARLYGLNQQQREARINRLLSATGLAPFRDRAAGKLSGGMKQKLSLCCALVHDPDLLILDEPTTGVDPLSRRQFWQLIQHLRAETANRMTVIVSTAYTEEAEQFDYLMAMDAGKILVNDLTSKVLQDTNSKNIEEAYTKLLPADKKTKGMVDKPTFVADSKQPYAIEAKNLTKNFGDFIAVNNVSFNIAKGEIFGFLGSNGCGKSTTMKMLTGLLKSSSGSAKLLGNPIDASNIQTRMRVGYMSQSFSLYEELTVYQNLKLHAQLYYLPEHKVEEYIQNSLQQFELSNVADVKPNNLSLGVKQRLQLAAACLHNPEVLILDEPTSGVDPAARDMFWNYLIDLSRNKKVTIFVSTHFMNEAALCDRISFMNQGRVLAVGAPQALIEHFACQTLEEAFITYLEQDRQQHQANNIDNQVSHDTTVNTEAQVTEPKDFNYWMYWWTSLIAFARRESMELLRDNIRIAFAILAPLIILICTIYSISFDVEKIKFTVLDLDQSQISSKFIEQYNGSRYFSQVKSISNLNAIEQGMQAKNFEMAIIIPEHFGQEILTQHEPEIAYYLDGANPFRASTAAGYIRGINAQFKYELIKSLPESNILKKATNIIEPRFLYNQSFKSIYAVAPGLIMVMLMIIPAMLTSLSVVREKEMGSIINLYASPSGVSPYLLGKLLPYIVLSIISFLSLLFVCVFILQLPIKGSLIGYFLGTIFYVIASGAFGLLISCFINSQVSAVFVAAILTLIPTANFSGLLYPVSTLSGVGYIIGSYYPASWYQVISLGSFTKGLGFVSFIPMYLSLIACAIILLAFSCLFLKKQEK